MTDQELIKRLRHGEGWPITAADRIEQLAATCEELVKERDYTDGTNDTLIALNQALEAKLAKAEAYLQKISRHANRSCAAIAAHALAELEVKE